ncbi:MAG TPA: alpha-E domain-containing protein, partial [Geminicoccaceae bacterium]|nr:alpha-E domain-containing protein [Geminicoccaceae bacterium]
MTRLLARWAENLFWLARYIERAENLARILDVQETFARDSGGKQDWRVVLVINADAEAFFARHAEADSASVLRFYVTD